MNPFYETFLYEMNKIYPEISDVKYADSLIFSALGGRICYSSDSPISILLNDKRVTDRDERISYLSRIANKHHFSIFAHSVHSVVYGLYPFAIYKSFPIIKYNLYGKSYRHVINARHVVEYISLSYNDYREKLIEHFESVIDFPIYASDLFRVSYMDGDSVVKNIYIDENVEKTLPDRYLLDSYIVLDDGTKWFVVVAHGYSRIFTHQLVRHTFFNFSQRSMRYTKGFGVYTPPSLKSSKVYELMVDVVSRFYDKLLEYGYKKEDARFIYPHGAKTTIMFSGPDFVFEDFIRKRIVKAAQHEIREVATILNEVLFNGNITA